jgi:hypothetical protein
MTDTCGGVSARMFYVAALIHELEAARLIFQYILHFAGINLRPSLPRDPPTWTVINARGHNVPHRTNLAVVMGTSRHLLRKLSAQATAVRDHSTLTLVSPWSYTRLPTSTNFTDAPDPPGQGKAPCSGPRNSERSRWRPGSLPVVGRIPCPELRLAPSPRMSFRRRRLSSYGF